MEFSYIGDELALFQHATNWKNYFGGMIRPYFGNDVLEVGAGTGGTTEALCSGTESSWVCLEPDAEMATRIEDDIALGKLPSCCTAVAKSLADLDADQFFDSVLYIDVLEHIEDDAVEASYAAAHLKPGGYLIVLAPAHQFLYTPFDKAIGHFRRYSKRTLGAAIPKELEMRQLIYLDSVGALASFANKAALRQSMPTLSQILLWDRRLVPLSRIADPIFRYTVGKSILGIWQKKG